MAVRELGGVRAREEEPMARHLPLRAAGNFELWAEVTDEADLVALVRAARAERLTIRPVGPFADAMPPEGGLTGVALRLGVGFDAIREVDGGLWVGAAALLAPIGLRRGFEGLRRAPGSLGEAWEDGWIAPMIGRVRRFRGRGLEEVDEATADARTLLVGALLRPGVTVHPPRSGELFRPIKKRDLREVLRSLGLGGLRLGGAMLAEDDPAVLVNRGEATARQMRLLREAVRERVQTATGIDLVERMTPPGRGGRL